MKYLAYFSIAAIALFYGCQSDAPTDQGNSQTGDYIKIHTAESGGTKFEVWSASGSNFLYGYNSIGFKVFINNNEKTTGFVKFKATMYHGLNGPSHTVPSKDNFYYDSQIQLFKGYIVFIMYDTAAFWAGDYNYNNDAQIDSSIFALYMNNSAQIKVWDNVITQKIYILSLVSPLSARVGLNGVELLLHESNGLVTYRELDSAQMYIKTWMESMGHGSGNNVNPVSLGGGMYRGTANFTMPGEWFLYDSIKYNGQFITKTPPPKFIFDVN
jgi:hypothetical protein